MSSLTVVNFKAKLFFYITLQCLMSKGPNIPTYQRKLVIRRRNIGAESYARYTPNQGI